MPGDDRRSADARDALEPPFRSDRAKAAVGWSQVGVLGAVLAESAAGGDLGWLVFAGLVGAIVLVPPDA